MSNKLSRKKGLSLNRLPNYNQNFNLSNSESDHAKEFVRNTISDLEPHIKLRENGAIASKRSQQITVMVLETCLKNLWRLGFKIHNVQNIHNGHIAALIRNFWAFGATPKYLAGIMTQLRKLTIWIKKPGLIEPLESYLPEVDPSEFKVQASALKSVSWSENGIDIASIIVKADYEDERFGLMLRMSIAFGLRMAEVLQIKPWLDDHGTYFYIRPGVAKGGRPRFIPIEHDHQRQILNFVKDAIGKDEFLGWPAGNSSTKNLLSRNRARFLYYMDRIGITKKKAGVSGHGLRAEYAENTALSFGLIPATLGGNKNQMPKEDEEMIKLKVSERMGHSRAQITSAYYGTLRKKLKGLGDCIGMLQVKEKIASVYVNPPFIKNAAGCYPELTKQQFKKHDLTVTISVPDKNGILDVADTKLLSELQTIEEYQTLLVLVKQLLEKYGVKNL